MAALAACERSAFSILFAILDTCVPLLTLVPEEYSKGATPEYDANFRPLSKSTKFPEKTIRLTAFTKLIPGMLVTRS